jgi:predicted nucleic acid-binding protein
MNGGSLLDTNILSETLRPIPNRKLVAWLEGQSKDVQIVSVVTIGEIRGARRFFSRWQVHRIRGVYRN